MIAIFCREGHAPGGALCAECSELEAYTRLRLEKCPYGEEKPTCADCPIHCYQPKRREQIRVVMAYAGPRMLLSHPVLAIRHILDGRRKAPGRPRAPVESQASRVNGRGLGASAQRKVPG